jgi:hypothetical protein
MTLFSTSSVGSSYLSAYTGYPLNSTGKADEGTEPIAKTPDTPPKTKVAKNKSSNTKSSNTKKISGQPDQIEQAELLEIERLKQRDQEVRAHERAHIMAGGSYVRGDATYQYQYGPDGHRYAVGGEVSIDMSRVSGDPEATIEKMRAVVRAALAPGEPSSQDRMVAAQASRIEMSMQLELIQLKIAQAKAEYRKSAEVSPSAEFPPIQPESTPSGSGSMIDIIG